MIVDPPRVEEISRSNDGPYMKRVFTHTAACLPGLIIINYDFLNGSQIFFARRSFVTIGSLGGQRRADATSNICHIVDHLFTSTPKICQHSTAVGSSGAGHCCCCQQ